VTAARLVPCIHCGKLTPVQPSPEQREQVRLIQVAPARIVNLPAEGATLEEIERQALIQALDMTNWVQKDAAALLSISPRVISYKIKLHGIELPPRKFTPFIASRPATGQP
jgi:transcriptional regulator with GAF, ATPase, and Fis domain